MTLLVHGDGRLALMDGRWQLQNKNHRCGTGSVYTPPPDSIHARSHAALEKIGTCAGRKPNYNVKWHRKLTVAWHLDTIVEYWVTLCPSWFVHTLKNGSNTFAHLRLHESGVPEPVCGCIAFQV
jgi:hypothetical protein